EYRTGKRRLRGMSNRRRGKALDLSSFIPIDIRYSSESALTCSIFDILFLKPARRAISSTN
ncbi:MAG: hypothetical protein U9R57_06825, partial [Thermodesulfobacteriota bacterium]|nr:hypothetical protein [Thermodesulfobacteriota bacterium]